MASWAFSKNVLVIRDDCEKKESSIFTPFEARGMSLFSGFLIILEVHMHLF